MPVDDHYSSYFRNNLRLVSSYDRRHHYRSRVRDLRYSRSPEHGIKQSRSPRCNTGRYYSRSSIN